MINNNAQQDFNSNSEQIMDNYPFDSELNLDYMDAEDLPNSLIVTNLDSAVFSSNEMKVIF